MCSAGSHSADSEHVGDACGSAIVPEAGFDPRERSVSTASPGCGDGVCVVDQLDGDPSPKCRPSDNLRCASKAEVEQAVYCSCRCDAPEGYAQCACPEGFRCETLLRQGSDHLRGGYCVRDLNLSDLTPR